MKYLDYLEERGQAKDKNEFAKAAYDLASLLDNPLLDPTDAGWEAAEIAETREEVFHDFCVMCRSLKITVPPYENQFYELALPKMPGPEYAQKIRNRADSIFKKVENLLGATLGKESRICRTLAETIILFPNCAKEKIELKNILAVINLNLVKLGLEPVRPDYASREVKVRALEKPAREIILAIFDDSWEEIIKTARALIGWANIKVVCLKHESEYGLTKEKKIQKMDETAQTILDSQADVVLMDQDLQSFAGSELIKYMRKLPSDKLPVFVANTGGNSDALQDAGALSNCDKGRNLGGVIAAVKHTL